jgi:hypothetical protein
MGAGDFLKFHDVNDVPGRIGQWARQKCTSLASNCQSKGTAFAQWNAHSHLSEIPVSKRQKDHVLATSAVACYWQECPDGAAIAGQESGCRPFFLIPPIAVKDNQHPSFLRDWTGL